MGHIPFSVAREANSISPTLKPESPYKKLSTKMTFLQWQLWNLLGILVSVSLYPVVQIIQANSSTHAVLSSTGVFLKERFFLVLGLPQQPVLLDGSHCPYSSCKEQLARLLLLCHFLLLTTSPMEIYPPGQQLLALHRKRLQQLSC
uniref:Uncharacterized protein n=1 Tax=Opuntia streptacantha TaxID=393608 RepID=A0A7C9A060_OPUST